jgi:hypothetical protein
MSTKIFPSAANRQQSYFVCRKAGQNRMGISEMNVSLIVDYPAREARFFGPLQNLKFSTLGDGGSGIK